MSQVTTRHEDTLVKLAAVAARQYKARCQWTDEDDLRQEAVCAILQAKKTFDPERGVPLKAYCWAAAVRWLYGVTLRSGSPVSPGRQNNVVHLRGLTRAPADEAWCRSTAASAEDDLLDHERRLALVEEILSVAEMAGAEEYTSAVLRGEARPRMIAEQRSVPVAKIYHEQQRFTYHAKQSAKLKQLWVESTL